MNERNRQIEGLRGIAIIFVMAFHFFCRYNQIYLPDSPSHLGINYWGNFGVAVFILISTYFLATMKPLKFRDLIMTKVLRLWPSYAICLVLIYTVLCYFPLPTRTQSLPILFANIGMFNGFVNIPFVDGAHWYIGVLLSQTVMFWLLSKLQKKYRNTFMITWLLFDISLFYMMRLGGIISTSARFVIGLIGNIYVPYALIGYCVYMLEIDNKKKWLYYGEILFALSCIWQMTSIGQTIAVMIALALFVLSIQKKMSILENHALYKIGSASYSIYLIHQNLGYIIIDKFVAIQGRYSLLGPCFAFLIMLLMGMLLYYLFELNVQKALKQMMGKRKNEEEKKNNQITLNIATNREPPVQKK